MNISHTFPSAWSGTRCFITIFFNFSLQYTIRKAQGNLTGLDLNETLQLLVYADELL
jgi:hypothetical protein